jgi:hypothetical protein
VDGLRTVRNEKRDIATVLAEVNEVAGEGKCGML